MNRASIARYVIPLLVFLATFAIAAYFYNPEPVAKGDKQYGGTLKISSKTNGLTFFPLADNTLEHLRIQALIFEPLLKPAQNKRGWRYCLASKISMSKSRKKVLIHLRKNIHFTDDPCFRFHSSELTAEDVAYSLSLACSQQASVQQDLILPELIVGGKAFYRRHSDPLKHIVKGLKIKDAYTLEIQLTGPFNHFLNMLSAPSLAIISKRAAKYYGDQILKNPIGTGPFQLIKAVQNRYIFARNPDYWRQDKYGNKLPFLNQIELTCGVSGHQAQQSFLINKLDILFDLPIDELQGAFGTLSDAKSGKNPLHEVYVKSAAKVHFIQFNCSQAPFNDLRVRSAFALAIDEQAICIDILKGEGRPLNNQFIPSQKTYQNVLLNPDKSTMRERIIRAKALLANSGYGVTKTLYPITFYVGAEKNTLAYKWSAAAARMLEDALNLQIILKTATSPNIKQAFKKPVMWRTGWVGDYPGAESYLRLFYSKAQPLTYFKNDSVDLLYLNSILARTASEKTHEQMRCENAILKLHPLIPIYTEDFIVLNQLRLRGLNLDESGMLDFSTLYIKDL